MTTIVDFLGWAGADRAAGLTPRIAADFLMPEPAPLMVIKPQHVADLNAFLEKRYPRTFESLDVRLRWKCLNQVTDLDIRLFGGEGIKYARRRSLSRGRARLMAYIAGGAS